MINTHLEKSLDLLFKDVEFLKHLPNKKDDYVKNGEPDLNATKSLFLWLFHIVDYNVTASFIDMDADLLRLCESDPKRAKELEERLNTAAMVAKSNYQVAFEDESCEDLSLEKLLSGQYKREHITMKSILPLLPFSYSMCLSAYIAIKKGANPLIWKGQLLTYEEMEFIFADNNIAVLEKKYDASSKLNFSVNQVNSFIDTSFAWADKIQEYLNRLYSNKNIIYFDKDKLYKLHEYCNGLAYKTTTAEKFAKAIRNISYPDFHVENRDFFYSMLYAIYDSLNPLEPKDMWLKSMLNNFDLPDKDYYNAKRRIDKETTKKLVDRFKEMSDILKD